jgi:hypothetical protein
VLASGGVYPRRDKPGGSLDETASGITGGNMIMNLRRVVHMLVGVVVIGVLGLTVSLDAGEKKTPEKKSGTVTGVLTAKGPTFIEVKADGSEKARKYVPYYRAASSGQAAGPDKEMVATFAKLKVGSRVRVEWEFAEHFRAVRVELLKAPAANDGDKKVEEKK